MEHVKTSKSLGFLIRLALLLVGKHIVDERVLRSSSSLILLVIFLLLFVIEESSTVFRDSMVLLKERPR